jgi:hypothetical protein
MHVLIWSILIALLTVQGRHIGDSAHGIIENARAEYLLSQHSMSQYQSTVLYPYSEHGTKEPIHATPSAF